jgi:hypothetical protein
MILSSKLETYQRICVTWGLQEGGATAPSELLLPKNFFLLLA